MDELDITAAEKKATYQKIKDYVWEKYVKMVDNFEAFKYAKAYLNDRKR